MTARIAGYVTRAQWGALPPKATTPLNGRRMEGVAVHHGGAGGYDDHAKCASQVRAYQRLHLSGDRGPQNDIAYNMLVCRHGYVFEGRTLLLQGGANGTSTANRTYFSVCVLGDGDLAFCPFATDAVEWVINEARKKYNAGSLVKRHRDFVSTTCPGSKWSAWAPTISGKPIVTVPKEGGPLRLGDRGPHVATLQQLLIAAGYDVGASGADGVFGDDTDAAVRKFQTDKGLDVDGIVGPQTLAALQVTPTTEGDPVRYVIPDADNPGRIKVVPPSTPGARPARDLDEADGNYLVAKIDALAAQLEQIEGYVSGVSIPTSDRGV